MFNVCACNEEGAKEYYLVLGWLTVDAPKRGSFKFLLKSSHITNNCIQKHSNFQNQYLWNSLFHYEVVSQAQNMTFLTLKFLKLITFVSRNKMNANDLPIKEHNLQWYTRIMEYPESEGTHKDH